MTASRPLFREVVRTVLTCNRSTRSRRVPLLPCTGGPQSEPETSHHITKWQERRPGSISDHLIRILGCEKFECVGNQRVVPRLDISLAIE